MRGAIIIKSAFDKLFYVFIFSMCLPSKDVFGLPVRTILFLLMAVSIVYLCMKHQIKFEKVYWLILFIFFCTGVWLVIGIINGFHGEALQQFSTIFFLISTVMIVYFIISNHLVKEETAKKTLYIVMFTMMLGKIIIETLVVNHILSLQGYSFLYNNLLGANNVTLSVPGLNLFRINSANDSLVLALLGFYLIDKKVGFYSKLFAVLSGTYFVLIVYSRVFFVQYISLLFIVLSVILIRAFAIRRTKRAEKIKKAQFRAPERMKIIREAWRNKPTKKILLIVSSLLVTLAIFQTFSQGSNPSPVNHSPANHSPAVSALNDRFNGSGTIISDTTRTQQSLFLIKDIKKNPVFGMGIGAYDKHVIRSQANKYSYEKEYYALLMQLGILGFCLIIIGTALAFVKLISIRQVSDKAVQALILFNIGIWLIKPLYNPGLISSSSSSIIASLIIISFCYQGARDTREYS